MVRQRQKKTSDEKSEKVRPNVNSKLGDKSLKRKKPVKSGRKLFWTFFLIIIALTTIYFTIPFIFLGCPAIRRLVLFMNYVNLQPFHNVSSPETDYGLNCTKSFFIRNGEVKLGAWHIFPNSRLQSCNQETSHDDFNDNRPVFLYFHGNGGTRGGNHRLGLYRTLAYSPELDAHVITVDYRGYGDSTPLSPTAEAVISDARAAYSWLSNKVNRSRIIVWGHSMGTAVSVRFLADIAENASPRSLVLEAPFYSLTDAVYDYPLAKLFRWLPYFNRTFMEPLSKSPETNFDSGEVIGKVAIPILFLHAADDQIIPLNHGLKLYQKAASSAKIKPEVKIFAAELSYGHKHIYKDSNLPSVVKDFVKM